MGVSVLLLALLLALPFAVALAVVIAYFLIAISSTLKLVSPEHRQLPPSFVWLCLIPGIGSFMAVWMVYEVASSLRKQFESLGDHQPGNSYGLACGRVWAFGLAMMTFLPLIAFIPEFAPMINWALKAYVLSLQIFGVLGLALWIAYWAQIIEYKGRLENHTVSGRLNSLSQEELDFGDDIGERKHTNNSGTGNDN
ncbi:hypothetical protein [Zavarzinella formosa]|uniref:hypothetical protein n=1 Tax=Zavarzinella formosa TaxID=360055 RepID=UPI000303763B|nr:hypothetical protein [Zavarzinella formosa]